MGGLRGLVRWSWPFVAPSRGVLAACLLASVVALATQSSIPYVVKSLLGGGAVSTLLALLAGLVVIDLVMNYAAARTGSHVAAKAAERLRVRMFGRVLDSTVLEQGTVRRTSAVSRHSQDVDRVEHAIDYTFAEGLPAAASVCVSLILLLTMEFWAGVMMVIAASIFLAVRARIARGSLRVEERRQESSADLEVVVDEAIGAGRGLTGLGLAPWATHRFHRAAGVLDHLTLDLFRYNSLLVLFARLAGLLGLTAVVVFSLIRGSEQLAAIAAALLYVEYVVSGLDKLRLWLLYVHSGLVSRSRIDEILQAPDRTPQPPAPTEAVDPGAPGMTWQDLSISWLGAPVLHGVGLDLPPGSLTAIVTPTWVDPDQLLAVLGGDSGPDSGAVRIGGLDARLPVNRRRTLIVPAEATAYDVSTRDLLCAGRADLDDEAVRGILDAVGLAHLADLPGGGLDAPLGVAGRRLTPGERQLLLLAVAIAADPDVLLVSSLVALTDTEQLPRLLAAVRRPGRLVLVAAATADVADLADRVVFCHDGGVRIDAHRTLLAEDAAYARHWETEVRDLDDLLLERAGIRDTEHLRARLVTEHFGRGDMLVRPGSEASSVSIIVSGRVEVVADADMSSRRRVAVLGQGALVGDIRDGAENLEAVTALEPTVVRTLYRSMASAGLTGLLDLPGPERLVITTLLRQGGATLGELQQRLAFLPPHRVESAVTSLAADGAVRADAAERWAVTQRRKSRTGTADLLDLIT